MIKQFIKTTILIAVLALPLAGIFALSVHAQTTSSDYELRCEGAQSTLRTSVRSRDLHTRVDRLQAYRYIEKNLDAFTQRLENNDQPEAEQFRELTTQLATLIDQFTNNYEEYDAARDSVSDIEGCRGNFEAFQKNLYDAREKRAKVSADVADIHSLLDSDVRNQLSTLLETLQQSEVAYE